MTSRAIKIDNELRTLWTTGVLTPEQQTPPVMKCMLCGEPLTLVLNHPPVPEDELPGPALVWGKDVACFCFCCSLEGCPHTDRPRHLRVLP